MPAILLTTRRPQNHFIHCMSNVKVFIKHLHPDVSGILLPSLVLFNATAILHYKIDVASNIHAGVFNNHASAFDCDAGVLNNHAVAFNNTASVLNNHAVVFNNTASVLNNHAAV